MDALISLILMAVVMTGSPGPNNVMVTASGAMWGFRRTIPHLMGVAIGFPAMILILGLGLSETIRTLPMLGPLIAVIGAIILAWFCWRLATADPHADPSETSSSRNKRPFLFIEAAAFQWVNPKAWIIAMAVLSTQLVGGVAPPVSADVIAGQEQVLSNSHALAQDSASAQGRVDSPSRGESQSLSVFSISLVFFMVALPIMSGWALFGTALARVLNTPIRRRAFNWSMALALAIAMVPSLMDGLSGFG